MAEQSGKSWWETLADKATQLGGAAVDAYEKYTGAKKTESESDLIDRTEPINWTKVALISGGVILTLGLVFIVVRAVRRRRAS